MAKCDVEVRLDPTNSFRAGEVIRGSVRLQASEIVRSKGVTLEIGWRVHGKGNTGRQVVHSLPLFSGQFLGEEVVPFEVKAPNGPVSHRGELLEVTWFARAQVDIDWAIDPKAEVTFVLSPATGSREPYTHGNAGLDIGPDSARTSGSGLGPVAWTLIAFDLAGVFFLLLGILKRQAGLIVFGTVSILIGTVALLKGVRFLRRIAAFKLGEVKVHAQPLSPRAGETVRVTVEVIAKPGARVDGAQLVLLGRERVVRGSGKNRRITHHELHRSTHELNGDSGRLIAGVVSRWTVDVPIPSGAAPTFMERDNQVEWTMDVSLELPGGLDWTDTVTLGVTPDDLMASG
jgi:hypothetical protein